MEISKMGKGTFINRRHFLKYLGVAAGTTFSGSGMLNIKQSIARQSYTKNNKDNHPNLLVIVTDDQGYGDLSSQPHNRPIETPNIDRIAENGIRMTDGYSTAPICSPSRMAMLTGRYPQRLGYYGNWDSQVGHYPDEKIAPHFLKPLGYKCAAIGKWHLGWQKHNHPLEKGFDYHFGFNGGMHDYFEADTGHTWVGGAHDVNWVTENGKRINEIEYMTDELTNRTINFIDNCDNHPFFIYLSYTTPHGPHQAKDKDLAKYEDEKMDSNRKVVRAMYDSLDKNIGHLLDHLKTKGLADNTFIVYVSDNGGLKEKAGCHNWKLRGSKGRLTEGGIRVPFLAQWPKTLPKGKVYREPVINIDILPSMLAAAGVDTRSLPEMDGKNLLPYWLGKKEKPPHETLHWHMSSSSMKRWAIREGDWKLVYALNGQGLFNLKNDVSETTDLRSEYPEIAEKLTAKHKKWLQKNPPSRVTDQTRRVHVWELRFRHEMQK
jgi:arylsulfatase A-like enzyme